METVDLKEERKTYIDSLGITYTATFQPTPQPADKVKHPRLHWLISLSTPRGSLQTTYHQGMAHVQGYKQNYKTPYDARLANESYRRTCETGRIERYVESCGFWSTTKEQPKPSLEGVLWCLVTDASVLDYSCYEEWAGEFGYDTDSRKGEKVYQDCIRQSLALKQTIGYTAIERLRELYQDY